MHRSLRHRIGVVVVGAAACVAPVRAHALAGDPVKVGTALDLVPIDAVGVVIIPDPKSASDDIAQCIARMDRPEAALMGRPIDMFKAQLGIGAGLDDAAPIVAWWQPLAPSTAEAAGAPADSAGAPAAAGAAVRPVMDAPVVIVGTTDPEQFLEANFISARDIAADAWRRDGAVFYARTVDKLVLLSPDAELVRRWQSKPGFAAVLQRRLGDRSMQMIYDGELSAWAGPAALATMRANAVGRGMREAGERAADVERLAKVAEGMSDALVAVDVDPLGLSVRTLSIFEPESDIGRLTRGGASSGAGVDRLPGNASDTMLAVAFDLRGLGGGGPFLEFARLVGIDPFIPSWVEEHKDLVDRVQFGLYRSKLGLARGVFDDSAVFIETKDPEQVRSLLRSWIEAMAGPDPFTGVPRRASWEQSRTLKSGETVSAFEVVDDESKAADGGGNAMMVRLAQQLVIGPKGFRGFVRVVPGGVVMTMSQRTDVLGRATDAASGKSTLAESGVVKALRRWLIPQADVEGFVGVGPIVRMGMAAAAAFGVPAGSMEIPEKLEPVAFAASVQDGRVETAAMIPTGVLAIMWDQAVAQAMPGAAPRARNEGAAPAPDADE